MNGIKEEQATVLREYWRIVWKRRWTVAAFTMIVVAAVTIFSFLIKPTYSATGTLLIEREPNILTFEQLFQLETFNDDFFQTQFKILQSRSLADETINRLRLYENAAFTRKVKKARPDGPKGEARDDPIFRGRLITVFLGKLDVKPVRQTRLFQVSFKDGDPLFAANALNTLFDAFIDMNVEKKYLATEQASAFLAKQIAAIREEIQQSEKTLQNYGAERNIIALNDKETTIVEKLGEFNRALSEAQLDLIQKEAYYDEIRGATPDFIPAALNNGLIERLREEYSRLSREYTKKQEMFLPDYPEMQRLKTELDAAKTSLESETQSIIKAAYSDYQAALKRYESINKVFNDQKNESIRLNNNSIQYNSLKNEIDNKKSLLESLMKRQSETGVSAQLKGLRSSNVSIVDRAEIPYIPSFPKKKLNMALALVIGFFGGLGLAFFLEYLDDSVKSDEDIGRFASLPTLGVVPSYGTITVENKYEQWRNLILEKLRKRRNVSGMTEKSAMQMDAAEAGAAKSGSIELITHFEPISAFAESYRSIRTSLLLTATDLKLKTLLVTSALPQEGKTTTVSNLGFALAQAGKRVLVVDADLRNPSQHRVFKVKNLSGLTAYLTSGLGPWDLILPTGDSHLFLMTAGPVQPHPLELLGSERMASFQEEMKASFDYVLFDSPPLLVFSDSVVIGRQLDASILVVWGGRTTQKDLKRARERLETHRVKCVGAILNNIQIRECDYYYTKRYYKAYNSSDAKS